MTKPRITNKIEDCRQSEINRIQELLHRLSDADIHKVYIVMRTLAQLKPDTVT